MMTWNVYLQNHHHKRCNERILLPLNLPCDLFFCFHLFVVRSFSQDLPFKKFKCTLQCYDCEYMSYTEILKCSHLA